VAINASSYKFPNVINKECFLKWLKKIQDCELVTWYENNENFSFMLWHLFILVFLSSQEIPAAFNILKSIMPLEVNNVVWFKDNYIHGKLWQ
jgi:hypothetical protein